MNIGLKPLAWSAAALVLLLSVSTPLSAFTLFLIMTPLVVLFLTLKPAAFAVHAAVIGAAAFLLGGAYGPLSLTLMIFFLVPSIVMGVMYRKRSRARSVLLAGFLVILAQLLLELILFSLQFRIDLSAELASVIRASLSQLETPGTLPEGWAADTADSLGNAIVTMLPMLLLLSSFLLAVVTHALSRAAMARSGAPLPGLPQAKTWRLPRSLVWYYLAALLLSYIVPQDGNGFWTVVSSNLIPILRFAFVVQAIGFFFFLADAKRWPKAVPVLVSIPLILFSSPLYLIGLLDAAFPLRRYFAK
ncbi:DUF2232 domain-containing protein [Cohnella caldifontis]|uniref:DUF2232 domain-containing protein n=1 Tax=Cohnella caldifontis TaxID=3027471 RepID=UPI0023EBBB76|nr:DUF2232 domain-containing protein [Cohnella sp. YIM B05605]